MKLYSIIVPVYNRPDHIKSLLECLTNQTFKNFEVIVVESGSTIKSDEVVESFKEKLDVRYIFKGNDGQGYSRNRGMKEAKGDYFIILDSDILLPNNYVENIEKHLKENYLDAFGGPDRLHPDSSLFQKAVNYCMTSFLTTGGTRGNKSLVGKYYPRSFNMGVSREVYEKVGGFNIPFMGEDLEWSSRIINAGFKTGLIENAYVHHERKGTLKSFYKQINFFGRARINISKLVPKSLKVVHTFPIFYCLYVIGLIYLALIASPLFYWAFIPFLAYNISLFVSSFLSSKHIAVGVLVLLCANALMLAYSSGMIKEYITLYILKKEQTYKL